MERTEQLSRLLLQISGKNPYSYLSKQEFASLTSDSRVIRYEPGQILLRADELPSTVLLVYEGTVRFLAKRPDNHEAFTLDKRGSGQLLGWVSLLRGSPCEWVMASETTTVISFPGDEFIRLCLSNKSFYDAFRFLSHPQENYAVLAASVKRKTICTADWSDQLQSTVESGCSFSFANTQTFHPPISSSDFDWFLSTNASEDYKVGTEVQPNVQIPLNKGYKLDIRCVGFPKTFKLTDALVSSDSIVSMAQESEDVPGASLFQLGILENDLLDDDQRFPVVSGKG